MFSQLETITLAMIFFILHSKEENKINLNYKSIDCTDNTVLPENYEITSRTAVTYFPYPQ